MNSRGIPIFPPETLASPSSFSSVAEAISEATGSSFVPSGSSDIRGGCINQASRIKGKDGRNFFLKQNGADFHNFFEAEAEALMEIEATSTVAVPEVIVFGLTGKSSFLVLSLMEEGPDSPSSQATLGTQLARLHSIEQPYFGWHRDNCIGATPQPNPRSEDWVSFYANHRLAHQFDLAQNKGQSFAGGSRLLENLPAFFSDYSPRPALLHGDLWGGNASCDKQGAPLSTIRRVITETGKPTSPSPICSEDSPRRSTRLMKQFIRSTLASRSARFSTTFITNSITSTCSGGLCLIRSIQRPSTSGSSFLKNDIKQTF